MNDLENTRPHLAQEATELVLQEKPATFQERFLVLDEEQLEEVVGGGLTDCCRAPRTSSPPRTKDFTARRS